MQPEIQALLAELVAAMRAEERAKRDLGASGQRVGQALLALRGRGTKYFIIATHIAKPAGFGTSVEERRGLATSLRKTVWRVTSGHGIRSGSPGEPSKPSVPSVANPQSEDEEMANKLLRKITTVEETFSVEDEPAKVEGLNTDEALEGADAANEDVERDDLGEMDEAEKPSKTGRSISGLRSRSKC